MTAPALEGVSNEQVAIGPNRLSLPARFVRALLASQALALVWWLAALQLKSMQLATVWANQESTFTRAWGNLADPYRIDGFVYPPWAAIPLAPFSLLPLPLAVLVQLCLYFAILTGVIFKFGGSTRAVLLALTSFIAFDSALELNIEWLVILGLLAPAVVSAPLLVIKPQIALGVWLSWPRQSLVRAVTVLLVTVLISLLVWGAWPVAMWQAIRTYSAGHFYNLAPLARLPVPVSLGIGAWAGWRAYKLHDPILAVLAWLFFVPYITLYSLLPHLALSAIRWPRVALVISLVMWLIYGGVLLRFFLHF